MPYKIYYSPNAEKYLLRLPRKKVDAIMVRIEYLALDPYKQDNNIVKLSGTISGFRLRVGDIRVIYELDLKEKIIYIVKIAPRGSVYLK